MKYEITINQEVKEGNDITLTLNTTNGGSIEIRSYGAKMSYEEFIEFADVIEELRQKFTVITSKKKAMIQPSLEIIKQSSEYKAAVALADIHNALSFKPEYFAKGICLQHRTLQQSIMRTFVATIRQMASDDYGYDDRNRSTHEAAKKMVESGILDEIYLPFI